MLNFKKKSLVFGIVLFLFFAAVLFVVTDWAAKQALRRSLETKANELIAKVCHEQSLVRVIETIDVEKRFVFFRMTLFGSQKNLIYDTHLEAQDEMLVSVHPEVRDALKHGRGYAKRYSEVFRQPFAYVASTIMLDGEIYVLRVGLPYREIEAMARNFKAIFFILGSAILSIYSAVSWIAVRRFGVSIERMAAAIEPYREGKEECLPKIEITKDIESQGEFKTLAETLNHLSSRVREQIHALINQQNETEAILNALGEGIVGVDEYGRITFMNLAATEMLKISPRNIIGLKLENLSSKRSVLLRKCNELIEKALKNRKRQTEVAKLEEPFRACFEIFAGPFGERRGGVLVLEDKTADYQMIEMGKDFIANTSHELRTPITIIRGFAETLHEAEGLSPEMVKEITGKILKTSLRFEGLVKSLLALSHLEMTEELSASPINLVLIAQRSAQMLSLAHPSAKIVINKNTDEAVIAGSEDLVEMALMNLLENAVKYSPAPAKIDLGIEKTKNQIQISVKDRGIGIPEADLLKIFDRFYTVDKARSRKLGGAGLGLSIVKTVLSKHGGEISVSSKIGQGSTFTMAFPLDAL